MSPHDSLAVHPDRSERSPTLPSSSGLCVRQIENEQQSTVGEVSQPLKVMALASRLAGPDNAVPSLPGSDSWLSKQKQKRKNPELLPARLVAVKLHFRCCRNSLDLVVNKHASITVGLSLEPGHSRAGYFPRNMLLLTTTARERAWRLLKITSQFFD